jgi:hypothetical protein
MALSLGWGHNQVLTQLEFRRRDDEIGSAELYTKYACIPPKSLAAALEQDLVNTMVFKLRALFARS